MRINVRRTESGKPTLEIETGGKKLLLYSARDPERDGIRFFKRNAAGAGDTCIFIGLGLGYHITPFLSKEDIDRIVILEPVPELLEAVQDREELRTLLEDRRVELRAGSDADDYARIIRSRYDFLLGRGISIFSYPGLRGLDPYRKLERDVRIGLESLINDGMTIGRFSVRWMNNLIGNVKSGTRLFPVSALAGSFEGTAVITGAGPSLDRSIDLLQKHREGVFLLATDASVKPLVRNGMMPDLIVSIDPQPAVFFHFLGLAPDKLARVPAVVNPLIFPCVFSAFEKKYVYFTRHPSSPLLVKKDISPDIINCTAVSTLAFVLACSMGFSDIHLAGFDFGYPGLRVYARRTFFYEHVLVSGFRLKTPETAETLLLRGSRNLTGYRQELEEAIAEKASGRAIKVHDWRTGGIPIRGAAMTARPVLGKPPRRIRTGESGFTMIPPSVKWFSNEIALTLTLRNRIYKKLDLRMSGDESERFLAQKLGAS